MSLDRTQRDRRIAEMKANGCTYQEIGDELGISRQRVQQIIAARMPDIAGPSMTKEAQWFEETVRDLDQQGMTARQIADVTGLSEQTVRKYSKCNPNRYAPESFGLSRSEFQSLPCLQHAVRCGGPSRAALVIDRCLVLKRAAEAGMTSIEASEATGIPRQAVYRYNALYSLGLRRLRG